MCFPNGFANVTRRDVDDNPRGGRPSGAAPGPRDVPGRRDNRDGCRMAHNPEVAGSNPAPATKLRGRFSNRGPASDMWFVHGFVHGICPLWAHGVVGDRHLVVHPGHK
jgi:hypothetical protein